MTKARRQGIERALLDERVRLQREIAGVTTSATGEPAVHGRLADEVTAGAAGASVEDDLAVERHASRELAEIERALMLLQQDPAHFGLCATCQRPIPLERLRLVPGTRYCRTHAPQ